MTANVPVFLDTASFLCSGSSCFNESIARLGKICASTTVHVFSNFTYLGRPGGSYEFCSMSEGHENWILSNKESQKTAESSKNHPLARGLSAAESKRGTPSMLFGKHQIQVSAY